jgi:L-cysteine/cystine lyase
VSDLAGLRAEFPVLERLSYLNAGTNGPVPARSVDAAAEELQAQAETGRGGMPYFEHVLGRSEELRGRVARLLGCDRGELALTGSTTDGVNTVLSALELGAGDEILTSEEEHPGLLAPLAAARERRGVQIRVVPFEELPGEVGPRTRLVACSHVSWISGRVLDTAALAGTDVPLLLDGAQGLGAVSLDVRALGCDFYAASGQKWLCGPNGVGYLYVRAERAAELPPPWPSYGSLSDPHRPLDFLLQEECRRFDTGLVAPHQSAWALAALDVLGAPGFDELTAHATGEARRLANDLAGRGFRVAPRGDSTLVSWEAADPEAEVQRLYAEGFVIRNMPGYPYVRASVGAWTGAGELERLAGLAA